MHVLTLTATPIPRTLQLALTGVRDLSIIASPPVDRLAVRTFVHALGLTALVVAIFALGKAFRPRALGWNAGFALGFVVIAVFLYSDRDLAPIFGHLSPLAGTPHR